MSTTFWDTTLCSPLKVNRRFGEIYRLHLHGRISKVRNNRQSRFWFCLPPFMLVSFSAYPSILKTEVMCSSEMSALSTDYTALHLRREYSSQPPLWELQIRQHSLRYEAGRGSRTYPTRAWFFRTDLRNYSEGLSFNVTKWCQNVKRNLQISHKSEIYTLKLGTKRVRV
jgi:hypothetical protein